MQSCLPHTELPILLCIGKAYPALPFVLQAKAAVLRQATELEGSRGAWQCKICYAHDVDAAFTGCGHLVSEPPPQSRPHVVGVRAL
jgi:hypothetical protein